MKIINFVVVFMILVCGSQLSLGVKLNCEFEDLGYYGVGSLFSCAVTSLANLHNNVIIDGHSRVYMANKNDADVKAIYIENTNTKYIPTNLGSLFNLTALRMVRTQLVEIKATDFHGMQDLEHLNFYDNNLSSVPLDVFTTLTKLRIIILGSNQIEDLPNDIFGNNLDMEEIYLLNNKIKHLGTDLFNGQTKLNRVDLQVNICVSKLYNGTKEINQLKDDIKIKCKNPNEVPATTTTTTQYPMEAKLIEMQEKIRKLEEVLREANNIQKKNNAEVKKASNKEKLNCVFGNEGYNMVGSFYTCEVRSLVNPQNNLMIDGYLGEHMTNKNDADVKAIWIYGTNTQYIPMNLGTFFNLTVLFMESTELIEIKSEDFHGMQDLEVLNLHNNQLTSVPLDAFATLSKLRFISLSGNQIEELPNGIFVNCLELEKIHLYGNKIKYLGTEIFNRLKIDVVDLQKNICINEFYLGATTIIQLKNDIKMKCKNPNEVPATTST